MSAAMLRHTYASDASAIGCICQQIGTIRDDPMEPGTEGRSGRGGGPPEIVQNLLAAPLRLCPAARASGS